jgi:RND superfamily putative drug exporter
MHLLGNSNWWLPAWLDRRLPHLAVEPKEEEAAPVEAEGPDGPASAVHGFVRTADGEPVDGAAVTLLSKGGRQLDRVASLPDGSYIVAVPAPGTYLIAISAASYGSRAGHVTVADGPLVYDVELAEGEVDATT